MLSCYDSPWLTKVGGSLASLTVAVEKAPFVEGGGERGVPVTNHRQNNTDFTNHVEYKTIIMDHVKNKEKMY